MVEALSSFVHFGKIFARYAVFEHLQNGAALQALNAFMRLVFFEELPLQAEELFESLREGRSVPVFERVP